jgi:6,7-dimethyl-8-ribityllumazine synthase
MPHTIEATLLAGDYSFALVLSRFNEFVTKRLLESALDCLRRHGASDDRVDVVYCPGAFELPQVAQQLAGTKKYDAIVCLGCVIRGETPHFEYIANAAANGLQRVAQLSGVPMIFGVLTADSLEQAIERAGAKAGNKGWDAALNAIEMANLSKMLAKRKR